MTAKETKQLKEALSHGKITKERNLRANRDTSFSVSWLFWGITIKNSIGNFDRS